MQRTAQQAKADGAAAVVRQQQAKLEQAQLNLGYTHVLAPATGIVNKKSVVVGANLGVGEDLLSIIPLDDLWVTANFKETQLAKMKPGQKVELSVDALGGRKYQGTVTQIGGATGSKLSLFPPENATGNYVKVVQRIPVRVDFTDLKDENKDHALRIGFSVTPKVSANNYGMYPWRSAGVLSSLPLPDPLRLGAGRAAGRAGAVGAADRHGGDAGGDASHECGREPGAGGAGEPDRRQFLVCAGQAVWQPCAATAV